MKNYFILAYVVVGLIAGLIVGAGIMGIYLASLANNDFSNYQTKINELTTQNNSLNNEIVSLTNEKDLANANKTYAEKQVLVQKQSLTELQNVYSDLFTDASSCYYANYCLYQEENCLYTLGDLFSGYTAREIHIAESDYCDGMARDWKKYQSYDIHLGD